VADAVRNFREGRGLVSCGLLAEITVNGKYGPGGLVPGAGEGKVAVRGLGASWGAAGPGRRYANRGRGPRGPPPGGRAARAAGGAVRGRVGPPAVPARPPPGGVAPRPGRPRAVLADRPAVPADLAGRGPAGGRRDRGGVGRRRWGRPAHQRPRVRRAAAGPG